MIRAVDERVRDRALFADVYAVERDGKITMNVSRFVAGVIFLLGFSPVGAVGLGEVRLDSYLGEPLRVRAPLILSQEELAQLDEATVSIGTAALFDKLGLQYKQGYANVTLELKPEGEGAVVLMSTSRPFVEPLIEVPLDIRVAGSRLVRVVTLLLDPRPSSVAAEPVAVPMPVSEAAPRRRAELQTKERIGWATTRQGSRFGPVAPNQTLGDVAETLDYSGVSFNQKLVALWRHNPDAFLHNNMNYLMAGSTLYLPSRVEVAAIPAGAAGRQVAAQSSGGSVAVAESANKKKEAEVPVAAEPSAPETGTEVQPEQNLVITAPLPVEEMPAAFRQEFDTLYRNIEEMEKENVALRERVQVLEEQVAVMSALIVDRELATAASPADAEEGGGESEAAAPASVEPPGDKTGVELEVTAQPAREKGANWYASPLTYLLLLVLAVGAVIVWLYRRRRQMDRMQLFLR